VAIISAVEDKDILYIFADATRLYKSIVSQVDTDASDSGNGVTVATLP